MVGSGDVGVGAVAVQGRLDLFEVILRGVKAVNLVRLTFDGLPAERAVAVVGVDARIHVQHTADAPGGAAGCAEYVVFDHRVAVERAVVADHAAHIAAARDPAAESVVANVGYAVVPGLPEASLAAEDTADIFSAGHCAVTLAVLDTHGPGIGRGLIVVTRAHDPAHAAARGGDAAVELAARDAEGPHAGALHADQAAHVVLSVDRGGADAAGQCPVELTGKGADPALGTVVADDHAGLHRTAGNGDIVVRAGLTERIPGRHVRKPADKARPKRLRTAFDRDVRKGRRAGDRTLEPVPGAVVHAVVVHDAVAGDLRAVEIQVFHNGAANESEQRLSPGGHGQCVVPAVERAGERPQVRPVGRGGLARPDTADGLPPSGKGHVRIHAEHDAGVIRSVLVDYF